MLSELVGGGVTEEGEEDEEEVSSLFERFFLSLFTEGLGLVFSMAGVDGLARLKPLNLFFVQVTRSSSTTPSTSIVSTSMISVSASFSFLPVGAVSFAMSFLFI